MQLETGFVQRSGHGSAFSKAGLDPLDEFLLSQSNEELLYIHRIHCVTVHFPDRECELFPVDRNAEQAPCGDHMIFRRFLTEILQRGNSAFAELDLIKHDQGAPFGDRLPAEMAQNRDEIRRADILIEGFRQRSAGLKIEISDVVVVRMAERKDRISLADLTRALNHQRLAIFALFPLGQVIINISIHYITPGCCFIVCIIA